MIVLKSRRDIAEMREAGRIVARVHEALREMIRPGVTTAELDIRAEQIIRAHGAVPAFLGYPHTGRNDFPASICASINEELVHGIPSSQRWLEPGDIISIDFGAIYKGYVGEEPEYEALAGMSAAIGNTDPGATVMLGNEIDRLGLEVNESSYTIA